MIKKGGREHETILQERRWSYAENVEEGEAGVRFLFESQYREKNYNPLYRRCLKDCNYSFEEGARL